MDLTEKLQIKPGQSLAILNPPPGVTLPTSTSGGQPSTADAVIGFAVHRGDLDQLGPVVGAARADRLAWIGYPKGGKLGTDLNRDRLAQALALLASSLSGRCPSMTPGQRCASGRRPPELRHLLTKAGQARQSAVRGPTPVMQKAGQTRLPAPRAAPRGRCRCTPCSQAVNRLTCAIRPMSVR